MVSVQGVVLDGTAVESGMSWEFFGKSGEVKISTLRSNETRDVPGIFLESRRRSYQS